MKPLKKLDGEEIEKFVKSWSGFTGEIPYLINKFHICSSMFELKNAFLSVMQLYYNGLIDNQTSEDQWDEQRNTLERLLSIGPICIGDFYRNSKKNRESIIQEVSAIKDEIKKYSSPLKSKKSHLHTDENKIYEMAMNIPDYLENVDLIIPIASEGFEPAFLLSDVYENPGILPLRYSRLSEEDEKVRYPCYLHNDEIAERIQKKRVVIVEGTMSFGVSARNVEKFVLGKNPLTLHCASVIDLTENNLKLGKIIAGGETSSYSLYQKKRRFLKTLIF